MIKKDNFKTPEVIPMQYMCEIKCATYWTEVFSKNLAVQTKAIFIGKIMVAQYYEDCSVKKADKKKFAVISSAPTIKKYLGHFETEQECVNICFQAAKVFCKNLNGM